MTGWKNYRSALRPRRLMVAAASTAAAAIVTCGLLTGAAGATTHTRAIASPSTSAPKPTIVFVHGAWADSSGFDAEIAYFAHRGYPVTAVANPLRGLRSDARYVRARLKTIKGPIVLVGHSYGGAVITNAATGLKRVKALVYLDAFSLAKGESVATVLPPAKFPGSTLTPAKLDAVPIANPLAPNGKDVDLYIDAKYFRDIFAGDVSKHRAALEAATQRPLTEFAYTQKSGAPAWRSIPSWDLIGTQDHAISVKGQHFMARRMKAHVETVKSAHDVMISHPKAVEKIIRRAIEHS